MGRDSLETAPSHDHAWSTRQPARSNHPDPGDFVERRGASRTLPAAAQPATSCEESGVRTGKEAQEFSAHDVRSPPRLQPSSFGPAAVGAEAAAPATTVAVAKADQGRFVSSSLGSGQAQVKGDGDQAKEHHPFGEDGQSVPDRKASQGQPAVPCSLFGEEGDECSDRDSGEGVPRRAQPEVAPGAVGGGKTVRVSPRKWSGLYGVPTKASNMATKTPPSPSGTTAVPHHNQRGGGWAAADSAVRDNWGSVFVVGGGRRRRRPPVRQACFFSGSVDVVVIVVMKSFVDPLSCTYMRQFPSNHA